MNQKNPAQAVVVDLIEALEKVMYSWNYGPTPTASVQEVMAAEQNLLAHMVQGEVIVHKGKGYAMDSGKQGPFVRVFAVVIYGDN